MREYRRNMAGGGREVSCRRVYCRSVIAGESIEVIAGESIEVIAGESIEVIAGEEKWWEEERLTRNKSLGREGLACVTAVSAGTDAWGR
jgi:hypothetical protein